MMKTAVLAQEPGASPGVTVDPFSPLSPGENSSTPTGTDSSPPLSPGAPAPRPPPSPLHRTSPSTPVPKSPLSPPAPSSSSSTPSKPSDAPHKPPAPAIPRPAGHQLPKPFTPPLPAHLPSVLPKPPSGAPQPRPPPPHGAKVSSPPLPRPPLPSVSRLPGGGTSAQPVSSPPASGSSGPASSGAGGASTSTSTSVSTSAAAASGLPLFPSISVLERLIKTCPVWLQLGVTKERATNILNKESPRIFLVRKDPSLKAMVLAVRLPDQGGAPQIQELVVKEEKSLIYLEGSVLVFDNIFKLIAFYCVSRDILPFTLRLPQVIIQATKYEDMEIMSSLGLEFWGSSLNSRLEDSTKSSCGDHGSSCEIQLSAGGDRLWYINPVFVDDHCNSVSTTPTQPQPVIRSQSLTPTPSSGTPALGPKYKRPPPLPPRPLGTGEGPSVPVKPSPTATRETETSSSELAASAHAKGLPGFKTSSPVTAAATAPRMQQARVNEEGSGERESAAAKGGAEREEPSSKQQQQQHQTHTAAHTPPGGIPQPAAAQRKDSGKGKRPPLSRPPSLRVPPVPRRRPSERQTSDDASSQTTTASREAPVAATVSAREEEGATSVVVPVGTLICLDGADMENQAGKPTEAVTSSVDGTAASPESQSAENLEVDAVAALSPAPLSPAKKRGPPVPPPRRKRPSTVESSQAQSLSVDPPLPPSSPEFSSLPPPQGSSTSPQTTRRSLSVDPKLGDVSIYSPDAAAGSFPQHPDNDSYSTSSAEDEADATAGASAAAAAIAGSNHACGGGSGGGGGHAVIKRTPTIMLDRAKHRLSMVNFSSVFTGIMSTEQKLQKRVVELSRDTGSYFGLLVRDHRTFTLDTLRKHKSSTEMLQEIRQMMTQLKSYLIQSSEIQNLQEPNIFSDEKLELIIEAALCKSVLKPIRESIYSSLRDIHTRNGTLKRLRENQQVVLATTTTDLGVTTSVPETPIMEKIAQKLSRQHLDYSPQKKIDALLKTCKMIYESMSVGSAGKAHGADDFLPVLMYVLARSNMSALLLDVEYMMELMDPALQLGEGSYYLTTTYGALEHIKNYDRQPATRQLSLEVQDSIHRWERRRTLNKARVSRSSVQDFINVSLLEAGANTKTLGVRPATSAQELCAQCAEKFEVLDPNMYCLSVLVDGAYKALAPDEKPLEVKSALHHSEPRKEYYFVYRRGRWPETEADAESTTPEAETEEKEEEKEEEEKEQGEEEEVKEVEEVTEVVKGEAEEEEAQAAEGATVEEEEVQTETSSQPIPQEESLI
ncbi:ras and Rab interactor 3 isoform X2 [Alosa pseudoharengus]|uniref:ras and Rab interactor 3 isoform X2 n=1 Tax=Alosa pseudoharengus TaxID=34774 RepID=UPI003F8BE5A5